MLRATACIDTVPVKKLYHPNWTPVFVRVVTIMVIYLLYYATVVCQNVTYWVHN